METKESFQSVIRCVNVSPSVPDAPWARAQRILQKKVVDVGYILRPNGGKNSLILFYFPLFLVCTSVIISTGCIFIFKSKTSVYRLFFSIMFFSNIFVTSLGFIFGDIMQTIIIILRCSVNEVSFHSIYISGLNKLR